MQEGGDVTDRPREAPSAGVLAEGEPLEPTQQAEEAWRQRRERWSWAEPEVWTERMLAAHEQGVKGGRWYSLMDKVYAERTLRLAWERVQRNAGAAGVDRQSVQAFAARSDRYLAELARDLRAGTYRPWPEIGRAHV